MSQSVRDILHEHGLSDAESNLAVKILKLTQTELQAANVLGNGKKDSEMVREILDMIGRVVK